MDARSALLDVARAKLETRSLGEVSLDEIRRAAEVSNGSLFHHFPTKNHLARALYLEALAGYQAELSAVLGKARTARAGVEAMVEAHVAWVLANRGAAKLLVELRDATAVEGDDVDWKKVNADAFAKLRAFVTKHVASGAMRELPFDVWMALVFAPVLQLTRTWVLRPKVTPAVRRALAEAAWAAVRSPSKKETTDE